MGYKKFSLRCSVLEHGFMEYCGNGDYVCPKCGKFYHDSDFDQEDTSETLSVYDAAYIWASNGKDEDYMFGYTEEELEKAFSN